MKKSYLGLSLLLSFIFCTSLHGQSYLLINVNLVDGINEKAIPNSNVLIIDGKIRGIAQRVLSGPRNTVTIDLKGKYLMPGMIDAHVHIRDLASAKTALESGVTTVRSMGVSHFMDVGMRELAKQGKIAAPEILAAGYHVRPQIADQFFMDRPDLAGLMEAGIQGEKAIITVGQAMVDAKVDWIKTNATARAGLPQTDPREPYYNEAELKVLVETGAKGGIPVAAHAHGDEGGRAAVLAGVKSIEHGTYLSPETLSLMAARGTYLVPTIAIVSDLKDPGGDYDQPILAVRGRHMLPRIRETARIAHEKGVKLIAATDTGYQPNSLMRLGLELEELVHIGMTPFEAVKAATSLAATFLEIDDHTGSIQKGLDADLLVLDKNPLEDVGAVHDPLMVMNNGKIIVDRLTWKKN